MEYESEGAVLETRCFEVLQTLGRLHREIQRLREAPRDNCHPHAIVRANCTEHVVAQVEVELELERLLQRAKDHNPELVGEMEFAIQAGRSDGQPCIRFFASDEGDFEDILEGAPKDATATKTFPVGIGADGLAVILSFLGGIGTSLVSNAIYDYAKRLRDRGLRPVVNAQAAVAICQRDSLQNGDTKDFGPCYATHAHDVDHAEYEVSLTDANGMSLGQYLVRRDGTICGKRRPVEYTGSTQQADIGVPSAKPSA